MEGEISLSTLFGANVLTRRTHLYLTFHILISCEFNKFQALSSFTPHFLSKEYIVDRHPSTPNQVDTNQTEHLNNA